MSNIRNQLHINQSKCDTHIDTHTHTNTHTHTLTPKHTHLHTHTHIYYTQESYDADYLAAMDHSSSGVESNSIGLFRIVILMLLTQ